MRSPAAAGASLPRWQPQPRARLFGPGFVGSQASGRRVRVPAGVPARALTAYDLRPIR